MYWGYIGIMENKMETTTGVSKNKGSTFQGSYIKGYSTSEYRLGVHYGNPPFEWAGLRGEV